MAKITKASEEWKDFTDKGLDILKPIPTSHLSEKKKGLDIIYCQLIDHEKGISNTVEKALQDIKDKADELMNVWRNELTKDDQMNWYKGYVARPLKIKIKEIRNLFSEHEDLLKN